MYATEPRSTSAPGLGPSCAGTWSHLRRDLVTSPERGEWLQAGAFEHCLLKGIRIAWSLSSGWLRIPMRLIMRVICLRSHVR